MVERYREGAVPDGRDRRPPSRRVLTSSAERFAEHVERFELTEALEAAWEAVRALNRFVEEQAPWTLAKDPGARGRARRRPRHAGRRHPRGRDPAGQRHAGHGRERMLQAVGAGDDTSLGATPRRAAVPAGARVEAVGALFPRVDEPIA